MRELQLIVTALALASCTDGATTRDATSGSPRLAIAEYYGPQVNCQTNYEDCYRREAVPVREACATARSPALRAFLEAVDTFFEALKKLPMHELEDPWRPAKISVDQLRCPALESFYSKSETWCREAIASTGRLPMFPLQDCHP